jgi:hypothetical protein
MIASKHSRQSLHQTGVSCNREAGNFSIQMRAAGKNQCPVRLRNRNSPQPHSRPAAILGDKLDASGFKGGAHLVDAANSGVLSCFKSIDSVHADASGDSELLRCPIKGGARHSALNRLHTVKLSPLEVDSNPATGLPLVV